MVRREIAVALLVLLTGSLLIAAGAQAATKTVVAGAPVQRPPQGVPKDAETNAFYRKTITIHASDRVRWQFAGFHTVTFPARGQKPPGFGAPDASKPIAGVNDAAGAPFWFNGQPRIVFNPLVAFPVGPQAYTGAALANSGAPTGPGRPKPYTLRFPKAGSYRYFCQIHTGNPSMRGTVRVVPRGRPIPSAAADRRAVQAQFAKVVARIKRDTRFGGPSGNTVEAGHDTTDTSFLRFFPRRKTIRAGVPVTFTMSARTNEAHTVTFGPADVLKKAADEVFVPDPASPPNRPPTLVVNPVALFPSSPPPALPPYGPREHGNGFLNTGILERDPDFPSPASAQVTFTTPGTYPYICLLHGEEMKGDVVVTQ